MSWYTLLLLYIGACVGWGMGQGWEGGGEAGNTHSISDTLGNGLLLLVASPFVPFIVLWHLLVQWRERRAERRRFYGRQP
jgi:hypothetical protein